MKNFTSYEKVTAWLSHNIVADAAFEKGENTSIQCAARHDNRERVEQLLRNGEDCDKADIYRVTPLIEASIKGHIEIAGLLLDYGAQLNPCSGKALIPIEFAALNSHIALVEMFLKRGADVNILTRFLSDSKDVCEDNILLSLVRLMIIGGAQTRLSTQDKLNWIKSSQVKNAAKKMRDQFERAIFGCFMQDISALSLTCIDIHWIPTLVRALPGMIDDLENSLNQSTITSNFKDEVTFAGCFKEGLFKKAGFDEKKSAWVMERTF